MRTGLFDSADVFMLDVFMQRHELGNCHKAKPSRFERLDDDASRFDVGASVADARRQMGTRILAELASVAVV